MLNMETDGLCSVPYSFVSVAFRLVSMATCVSAPISVIPPPSSCHSMLPRMLSCTPTGPCTLTTRPGHCLRSPKNGCVFKVSEAGGR